MKELFENVDWGSVEAIVNTLTDVDGRGRRPRPPIAYHKAIEVKRAPNV